MNDLEKDFAELFGDLDDDFTEDLSTVITLNDEDGNEVAFDFLDLIPYEGEEYVVLLPIDDDESGKVVILKVANMDTDEEAYVSIDDTATLTEVFNIFREKFKDEFDFSE